MNRIVALALVCAFMLLARIAFGDHVLFADADSTMSFGFLLLAAYLVGDVLAHFEIPKLTGYILAGIVFGPNLLGFVDEAVVLDLKLINDLALTFIALAAGGELRLDELRQRTKSIGLTVFFQIVFVFFGVAAFVVAARSLLPFLDGSTGQLAAVAAIMGTFAVARSPSSAIAIISECKARGPFTETVLGVTVVMDLLVIVLFAVVVSFSQVLIDPAGTLDFRLLGVVLVEVVGSILGGIFFGMVISFYIRHIRAELIVFVLAMAFMVAFFSRQFAMLLDELYSVPLHLEPMLICVTAGFWVRNFSRGGEQLMQRIDESSLPIYVVFFALTGASLDIGALRQTWLVAVLLVAVRFALIWLGAFAGARLAGDPQPFRRLSGLSYVTQAGVSLGLAEIIVRRFPEWGPALAVTVVAVITLNQIVGPVALKYALGAVGEARARGGRGSPAPAG